MSLVAWTAMARGRGGGAAAEAAFGRTTWQPSATGSRLEGRSSGYFRVHAVGCAHFPQGRPPRHTRVGLEASSGISSWVAEAKQATQAPAAVGQHGACRGAMRLVRKRVGPANALLQLVPSGVCPCDE